MNIIEKLGIEKGYYEREIQMIPGTLTGTERAVFVESEQMKALKNLAPEMLLSIIGFLSAADDNDMSKGAELLSLMPELIEKATGLSWDKIKTLI